MAATLLCDATAWRNCVSYCVTLLCVLHEDILHEAIGWRSGGSILGDAIVCLYCMSLLSVNTAWRYSSCHYCVTLFLAPLLRLSIFGAASAWRYCVTLFCVGIAWWYSLCHYRVCDRWRGCVQTCKHKACPHPCKHKTRPHSKRSSFQGILKWEVSLYHWTPVWLVWNQLYGNWKFFFLFENQTNPNQSNRR